MEKFAAPHIPPRIMKVPPTITKVPIKIRKGAYGNEKCGFWKGREFGLADTEA
jgi:hypothetical protein